MSSLWLRGRCCRPSPREDSIPRKKSPPFRGRVGSTPSPCPVHRLMTTRSIAAQPSAISTASLFDRTCPSSRTHIDASEVLRPPFTRSVARAALEARPHVGSHDRGSRSQGGPRCVACCLLPLSVPLCWRYCLCSQAP